jgi:CBS domain-containing protein
MNTDEIIPFFRNSPLFQDLAPDVLQHLTTKVNVEVYPRGTVISRPEGGAVDRLRIIKEGSVKVAVPFGRNDDALIDYRGKGEILGFISLLTGGRSGGEVVALEDTTCYLIERTIILDLLKGEGAFAQQFFREFFQKYVNKPHREIGKKKLLYGGGERLLFTTPVGELTRRDLVTASEEISIREAAALMSKRRIGSLVLINPLGLPSGIVTNRDFKERVVSRARDVNEPVKKIQSVSLVKAEAGEHCIEALFKMIRYNIRHLLVVDGGRLVGILTAQDLFKLQGTSPISLVQELESQPSIDGLVDPAGRIQSMVGAFLEEGVKAAHILRILTVVYDRLLRQSMALVERSVGPPPVPYCFISFGCAGREEQAFMTAQQNGVIYADPANPEEERNSLAYFSRLSSLTVSTFDQIGFPAVDQDITVQNPCWCQSLKSWKETFFRWMDRADRRSVEASLPALDFRCRRGDSRLADDLRGAVIGRLGQKEHFIDMMAINIVKNSPPLSAFKKFVLEKRGDHRGRFDLKEKGIRPLVDIVRLYALKAGVWETSTQDRMDILRGGSPFIREYGQELEYAFEVMNGLRVRAQYENWRQDSRPHSYIDPDQLNQLEKKALKEIFSLIARIQVTVLKKHEPIEV